MNDSKSRIRRVRLAVPTNALPLFRKRIIPYFQKETSIKLKLVELSPKAAPDKSMHDLALIPTPDVSENGKRGEVLPLNEFRLFLRYCRAFSGGFVFANRVPFGMQFTFDGANLSKIPSSHSFFKDDGVALTVLNRSLLNPRGRQKYYVLQELRKAIYQFMPIAEQLQGEHIIRFQNGRILSQRSRFVRFRNVKVDPKKKIVSFDVNVVNSSDEPINELEAVVFGAPAKDLLNRHGSVFLKSSINRIGPMAVYVFGSMLPGDSITRNIQYNFSKQSTIRLGWSPQLDGIMPGTNNSISLSGGLCKTQEPDIFDPILDRDDVLFAVKKGCVDNNCKWIHGDCNPHSCRTVNERCGCYPKRRMPIG